MSIKVGLIFLNLDKFIRFRLNKDFLKFDYKKFSNLPNFFLKLKMPEIEDFHLTCEPKESLEALDEKSEACGNGRFIVIFFTPPCAWLCVYSIALTLKSLLYEKKNPQNSFNNALKDSRALILYSTRSSKGSRVEVNLGLSIYLHSIMCTSSFKVADSITIHSITLTFSSPQTFAPKVFSSKSYINKCQIESYQKFSFSFEQTNQLMGVCLGEIHSIKCE